MEGEAELSMDFQTRHISIDRLHVTGFIQSVNDFLVTGKIKVNGHA